MTQTTDALFDLTVWEPALKKYGAVVQLSVALYGADEQRVCEPLPATPITTLFQTHGYDPGIRVECVQACLAQTGPPHPIVVSTASQLAVVGVPLQIDGRTVGAAVGGYTLVNYCDSVAIARLARASGTPFPTLWAIARHQAPVPARRLAQHGELLQVLVDTLLRENALRRQAEQAARRFSHLADHDPLTQLPNRLLLADRLARALALAQRHGRRMALLFVDIDRFKHINDSLGHALGDGLLQIVAREITRCVRSADTVSRYGGDEFVVLLTEVKRAEDAGEVAMKIIAAVTRPQTLAGHELRISVSLGISVFPDDGQDAETLLKQADSAVEFRSKGFLEHIVNILDETGLDPRWLEIELTESVLMVDVTAATAVLRALKTLGVQLAIDDFGTGWSSLSYLRHLPVDALKIDKSFVQEITPGSNAGPIVSAVISMAKSLKHRVIAEGVETREQLAFLQAEECGEGQGYYFSRPLIPTQFARVMERGTTRPGGESLS